MAGKGKDLFRQVEEVLAPLGFARETRRFTPHATLARVKVPDPSLFTVLRAMDKTDYGDCMISGMKLKKSTLTPRGPVYEDLLEVVMVNRLPLEEEVLATLRPTQEERDHVCGLAKRLLAAIAAEREGAGHGGGIHCPAYVGAGRPGPRCVHAL